MSNVAHFEKYTRGAAQMVIAHDRRDKHGIRENIDESRTYMNYNLCDCDDETTMLNKIINDAKSSGAYIRDDTNVICSCVITLPKDFQIPNLEKEFFKGCYEFMCDEFGKENMISAWVHKDEKQPHIHIKFCPIVEKEKTYKNGNKKTVYQFEAYKKVSRTYLRTFHKRLEEHLTDYLGFAPHILNGATKGGNKSIEQLKNETYKNKCIAVYESNKKIIAGFWDEYKNLSASYWSEYKRQKQLIQKEMWALKNGFRYNQENIEQALLEICSLSSLLLYMLCKVFMAICALIENKDEYQRLNRLESDLERLEGIRRRVSNYQHNTKEKLKESDIEGIEDTLKKWEESVKEMNMFFYEYSKEKPAKKKEIEYER